MRVSDEDVRRANQTDIYDALRLVGYTFARQRIKSAGPCPLCGGSDRFWANGLKRIASCRQCMDNHAMDPIGVLVRLGGRTFAEAVVELAGVSPAARVQPAPRPAWGEWR